MDQIIEEKDKEPSEITKLNSIIENIINKEIILKLKKNLSFHVDGRIIRYSELIKLNSCDRKFDYRLNYENIDRQVMTILVEFFKIVNWKIDKFTFKIKFGELDCWYQYNKQYMEEIISTSKFLKIHVIIDFINYYKEKESLIVRENGYFKMLIDAPLEVVKLHKMEDKHQQEHDPSKDFESASPPELVHGELSFKIPIQIFQVKLNANKNNIKSKFNIILKDKELDMLIDAMICDSFWFVVLAFHLNELKNGKENKSLIESKYTTINDILKRLSQNYFNFFIKLCELNKHNNIADPVPVVNNTSSNKFVSNTNLTNQTREKMTDENAIKDGKQGKKDTKDDEKQSKHYQSASAKINSTFNKDSILDVFHDYMSQCVYYSLYLAFPKSRHKFDSKFKQFLISFFGYMFNGLNVHNKYNTDHWELDLGSGNIIEPDEVRRKSKIYDN